MAEELQHPEAVLSKDVQMDPAKKDRLLQRVTGAINARNSWDLKMENLYNQRYGLRPAKTFPWPNCSNLSIPMTDSRIRTVKPLYINTVFQPTPILTITPVGHEDPERARRVEHLYDWLIRSRMNGTRKAVTRMVDAMLVYGFGFMKVSWRYDTTRVTRSFDLSDAPFTKEVRADVRDEELNLLMFRELGLDPSNKDDRKAMDSAIKQFREGRDLIQISFQHVTYDAPWWEYVAPWDIIVPWDSLDAPEDANWMTHRIRKRPQTIMDNAEAGLYDKKAAEIVVENMKDQPGGLISEPAFITGSSQRMIFDRRKYVREGVTQEESEPTLAELWEIYFYDDINGDGLEERVVGVFEPITKQILSLKEYPYEHNQWPITKFNFEDTEDRWYAARGITEMLWDLQAEVNAQHNMWIDRQTLQNSMMFKYRRGSIRNPDSVRPKPGLGIEVQRMDDLQPLTTQVLDFSYNQQEQVLKFWADEYIGNTAASAFSNIQNRVERRTAAEVDAISSSAERLASSDILMFQKTMKRVHFQTLRLFRQFGEDKVAVRVDPTKEPVVLNVADLDGHFDLIPTGNFETSDRRFQVQKIRQDMEVAANPFYSKFVNHWELVRDYFELSDFRDSQRFLRAPGLFEQDQAQEQAAEVVMMQAVRRPVDVFMVEDHEVHLQVLQQAIPVWAERDPELAQLLQMHAMMHLVAMGQLAPDAEDFQTMPWVPQALPDRIVAVPNQQQQPQGVPPQGVGAGGPV